MTVAESSVNHGGIYLPRTSTDRHGNAGDVVNDNGDNLRPNQYPLGATRRIIKFLLATLEISKLSKLKTRRMYINNINNIDRQQQFRSPTSRAAQRIWKEIGWDSLDLCPQGLGEKHISVVPCGSVSFRELQWFSVVQWLTNNRRCAAFNFA